PISSLPWADFSSFQLNIYNDGRFLLPIFTLGRVTSQGQQFKLPLCLQVHHAVCDGFHASRFAQEVEALAADCSLWM
ncbi:MAG: CatA-like O-acetyltransferase, partial [Pygmaiobacter massiliensis]